VNNCQKRLALLRGEIRNRGLDSFLITSDTNVSYLSGFKGHDSVLLVTAGEPVFITDSRYIEEAKQSLKGLEVRLARLSTYSALQSIVKKKRLRKIGFESMNLPYEVAARLKRLIADARLIPVKDLVERLRAIKDDSEIRLIKDSIRLARKTFEKISNSVRPGMTEKFIAKKAEIEFIRKGASASFEPIVASGANSSKPHAIATDATIGNNSFVMIDMGCNLNGYNSDITRMISAGSADRKFKKIYEIVNTAQAMAIAMIRPGVRAAEIDREARGYIRNKGFGKYFGHALGHGVGLEVHEQPAISRINEELLKEGMVFTVEPAIYIPGFGGVRIEDMVVVTGRSCEVLTR